MRTKISTSGFSLVEVIISTMIISLLVVSIFQINSFLLTSNADISRSILLNSFGSYLSDAVSLFPPPNGNSAYYAVMNTGTLSYSNDPNYQATTAGFFSHDDGTFSQIITPVSTTSFSGGTFTLYRLDVRDSLSLASKTFFITR